MRGHQLKAIVICLALLVPSVSQAYLGPGVGVGTIGVVLGVLIAIFLAIVGIFWYPLKRLLKKHKKETAEFNENSSSASAENSSENRVTPDQE